MNSKQSSNKIKAVFFDLGGVIVTSVSDPFFAYAAQLLRVGKKTIAHGWLTYRPLLERGMVSYRACMQMLGKHCGLQGIPPHMVKAIANSYRKFAKVDRRMLALIRLLKRRGYVVGLISNTHEKHTAINFKRRIFKDFDALVLSYRVGLMKPDPAIFKLALLKVGVKPHEAVFIDDNAEFVKAAKKLGMQGIVFRGIGDLRKQLRKYLGGVV
ncbi:MAG: HAD family phosphatase [Parcubacteria group bacterium]|nr:HAD family phosphatase [Parcubacteria group bacterium]